MQRHLATSFALGLLATALSPLLAVAQAQAPGMLRDAKNALNPGALNNLGLGTTNAPTFAGLTLGGAASLSHAFAGTTPNWVFWQAATAGSATIPEVGGHFSMTSSTGAANLTTAYKMGLATEATCNSGSASCWGLNTLVTLGAGGTLRGGIGYEVDLNNNQGSFPVTPSNPYGANFYATGTPAGGFINNFAFGAISATGSLWHQGFLVQGTNAVDTAAFEDMSTGAPTSFLGANGMLVGSTTMARRALNHTYIAGANNLEILDLVENDNSGSGVAALGFSVTGSGTETRSTKGGVGYQRTSANGGGNLLFYNRSAGDTSDFTASDVVMTQTLGGGWQIGAPPGGDKGPGTLNSVGLYVNGVAAGAGGTGTPTGSVNDIQTNAGAGNFGHLTPGTGVATALGVNVGSAGAFVTNGGALGTPSSGVGTNLTGTASGLTAGTVTTNANLTGPVTSTGNATAIANGAISDAMLASVFLKINAALGTPVSGVATNLTGTAAGLTAGNVTTNANLTGPVTSVGNATTITSTITAGGPTGSATVAPVITYNAAGQLTTVTTATIAPPFSAITGSATLAQFPTEATNTVLGNATSGTAVPTALAVGGCSSSTSALIWTTNTGFGCNTAVNAATLGGATFAAPGAIGGGTAAAGTFTALSGTSGTHTGLTGLGIRDTSAAFDVTLAAVSSTTLTAGRTLTLDMKNVAHTLAFGATANTITYPNTASYTLIGSGDTGTVTNTMLAGSIDLTTKVTGTLPYGNGGTGATAFTNHGAVVAGAFALSTVAPGANGNVLTSNGTDWTSAAAAGNGITGSGTANTIAKFTGSASEGNSSITDDGTTVTVNEPIIIAGGAITQSGNISSAAWTTNGVRFKGVPATFTDTSSSGTVAAAYTNVHGGSTIAASSATTFTNYFNTYIKDPIAGANVTFTSKYSLGADTIYTPALALGAAGTAGTAIFGNATSGTVTLATVTGALGSVTASLPANTGTVAETNLAQTFSATQTFGSVVGGIITDSTTARTLAATDCGQVINFTNAGAVTLTTLSTLPVGCHIVVRQATAGGQVTVSAGGGGTIVSASSWTKTRAQYSKIGLSVIATTVVDIDGDGV